MCALRVHALLYSMQRGFESLNERHRFPVLRALRGIAALVSGSAHTRVGAKGETQKEKKRESISEKEKQEGR